MIAKIEMSNRRLSEKKYDFKPPNYTAKDFTNMSFGENVTGLKFRHVARHCLQIHIFCLKFF